MAGAGLAVRGGDQLMKDAALTSDAAGAAAATQGSKLSFQRAHALQPRPYPRQLRVDQPVDVAAVGVWMRHELQQALDIRQRYIERSAMADEGQPFEMRPTVGAVAVTATGRVG